MKFRVRNTFYLRLSASDVITLYIYLDEKHVEWMTERTLASVISDLRPLVGPKLEAERYYGPGGPASAKKGTTEVHRSDTYQFAYFLRKVEPHAIVVKTRNYTMVKKPPPRTTSWPPERMRGKRKLSESNNETQADKPTKVTKRPRKRGAAATQSKTRNKKGKAKAADIVIEDSEEEAEESPLSEPEEDTIGSAPGVGASPPRRSTRNKKTTTRYIDVSDDDEVVVESLDNDVEMQAGNDQGVQVKQEVADPDVSLLHDSMEDTDVMPPPPIPPDFGIAEDEEEKKLKPDLQLSFRGLDMRDRCLCVVVEPWPALPDRPTPAPTDLPSSRAASMAPPPQSVAYDRGLSAGPSRLSGVDDEAERSRRGETPLPLFLPDPSRDRSATPAPMRFPSVFSSLDTIDDMQYQIGDDDEFGMLAFSQALNNVAGDRVGVAEEDDDEMDGGALYGDADEMRGIIE